MKVEDIPFRSLEPARWNRFLDQAGCDSPFCREEWLSLLDEAYPRWRVRLLLAAEGDQLVGGLPHVDSIGHGFFQSHALPWGTPCGVVVSPGKENSAGEELLQAWTVSPGRGWRPRLMSLTFPGTPPGQVRLPRTWRFQRQRALRVPLAGRSFQLWETSLSDSVRSQNRQALRRGATFEKVSSPEEAGEIYHLARVNAIRHGKPGPALSRKFYSLALERSGQPGFIRVYMVRVQGKPAAFSVCLVCGSTLWLWDYGADSAAFAARPNNLMYSRVIAQAFEEGLEKVDLGAVPPGAESLETFKRSFGGVPYQRISAVDEPLLYRLARKLRNYLYRNTMKLE